MSGRGSGSKGYESRGGRGRGNNRKGKFQNNKRKPEKEKKTLKDYNYYLGSSKQASDYETTTEFIINHIKKTYTYGKDIAQALKDLEPFNLARFMPRLQMYESDSEEEEESDEDEDETEEEREARREARDEARHEYENNLIKAYALIWERCTKGMQNKISNSNVFDALIYDNPIELLKEIKRNALNYQEFKYDMSIVADAFRNLFGTTQKENESLQEYARRFKTSEEILTSHMGGSLLILSALRRHPEFDSEDVEVATRCADEVYQRFLSYLFLEQSDQSKYGTLVAGLNTQHSLQNDQYPKTMSQTTQVMSNHKFDPQHYQKKKNDKERGKKKNEEDKKLPMSFAQMEGRCYACGAKGQMSNKHGCDVPNPINC